MSETEIIRPLPNTQRSWIFKINGGSTASIRDLPYQAYLIENGSNDVVCGATILSSLIILTAAHCFVGKAASSLTLVAGDQKRSLAETSEQRIRLAHLHIHEGFNLNYDSADNDIAIGVLSSKLTFSQSVSPISFPTEPKSYIGYGTISGWGRADDNDVLSDDLKAARLPIVPVAECDKRWMQDFRIRHHFICAFKNGTDVCSGDSGGPLTGLRNGVKTVIGVIAVGPRCDINNDPDNIRPGVYINVSRYGTWILLKMLQAGENPTRCTKDKFWCSSKQTCISSSWVCDGDNDCGDNADEANCKICQKGKFRCESSNKCISDSKWCDGSRDCPGGEDEPAGCNSGCPNEGYRCKRDKRCIPKWAKCNWRGDCDGDDDEVNCPAEPSYTCRNNATFIIPENWKCDGKMDCPGGDDENSCAHFCNVSCRPYQNNQFNEAISRCCIAASYAGGHCNPGDVAECLRTVG